VRAVNIWCTTCGHIHQCQRVKRYCCSQLLACMPQPRLNLLYSGYAASDVCAGVTCSLRLVLLLH
jgi:hypothetical protein